MAGEGSTPGASTLQVVEIPRDRKASSAVGRAGPGPRAWTTGRWTRVPDVGRWEQVHRDRRLPRRGPGLYARRVTNWDEAAAAREKVAGYLLAEDHPSGRAKAAFFGSLGYDVGSWELLRDDLVAVGKAGAPGAESETDWGTKFVIDGAVVSPVGRAVNVRTVWIVDRGRTAPRLVTAYPL